MAHMARILGVGSVAFDLGYPIPRMFAWLRTLDIVTIRVCF